MADMTHSEGCFRWHHGCAIAEVERLRAEVAEHLLRADSLRAELARQQDENERLHDELHLGQDEAKRLRAAVQAVLDLHMPVVDGRLAMRTDADGWCDSDKENYPCPTIRALDAALGGERDE